MAPILEVRGVTKRYGRVTAIQGLDLSVEKGEVFGFLGPNGAGKTTTIKVMLALARPDAGSVTIAGIPLSEDEREAKRRIGYLPERVAFYPNLTGRQVLAFYGDILGVSRERRDELLAKVGLADAADRKCGGYSKGMLQRLGLAKALLGDAPILLLDEPTSGLDPHGARLVKDIVLEANRAGRTVFFSTHLLAEAQELSHRVGIVHKGRTIATDSVDALSKRLDMRPRLTVHLEAPVDGIEATLRGLEGVSEARLDGRTLVVACDADAKKRVLRAIEDAGGSIADFRTEEARLEDVFLTLTKEG
ncbi:MAG: ABC transporter ATP-binding protein [Methanobacteriota archaeon]